MASAVALVRPPGHHAEAAKARGFCIFSNVAIDAKSLLDLMHLAHGKIVLAPEGKILHKCIDKCIKALLGDFTCTHLPSAQAAEETQSVIDKERPHQALKKLAEKYTTKAPKAIGKKLSKEKSSAEKALITTHAKEATTIVAEIASTPTKDKVMATRRIQALKLWGRSCTRRAIVLLLKT